MYENRICKFINISKYEIYISFLLLLISGNLEVGFEFVMGKNKVFIYNSKLKVFFVIIVFWKFLLIS